MSKYSNELKLKVIEYYLNNSTSCFSIAKHFTINYETIRKWIKRYEKHGIKGLIKNQTSSYNGEFKIYVVEYMQKNQMSLTETSIYFNLGNPSVVDKWEKLYNKEGAQAFLKKRRELENKMNSKFKKEKNTEKELLKKIQQLEMENEYLKKLNALVQERIKQENKKK